MEHQPSLYKVRHVSSMVHCTFILKSECLKEYAHQKHDVFYKEFPLSLVTINEAALKKLSDDEKSQLKEFGITM